MSYIGSEPTTAAFPFDQFSGDGTTTAFTLTYAPASTTSIIVAISGVMQNPNLYSVVGTTLTFSPAPPTGTNNISVLYLGLPVIGSSSPGNTAFLSSTDLTATASQTVFASAGSYTPGFVQVYRNGARLGNADFTATNGTTITLASAATAGDLVTIEYYTLTSLTNALPLTGGTVTGTVTFNSAITGAAATFSGIVAANGGGIQFPATQVASAGANTLDDYEEGTWTPSYNAQGSAPTVTYANQTGRYIKIGRVVYFSIFLTTNSFSGGSGAVIVVGWPFAADVSSEATRLSFSTETAGAWGVAADTPRGLNLYSSTQAVLVYRNLTSWGETGVASASNSAGSNVLEISGCYLSAS
jgi:hypothetical protein